MKLLFLGNSHTYYNSMPDIVARLLDATGVKVHVTMQTEGGKGLGYHAARADVSFNIRHGHYDFIVAQDRSAGFEIGAFREAVRLLKEHTDKASSSLCLYMPWTARDKREAQNDMTEAYLSVAKGLGCSLAPVGEVFTRLLRTVETDLLYREDGNHTTPLGSYAAAVTIFYTVTGRKRILNVNDIKDPGAALGISPEICQKIHEEACRASRLYNG